MAATEMDPSYRVQERSRSQSQGRGFFISTEARPAFVTSEFWLTIIGTILAIRAMIIAP